MTFFPFLLRLLRALMRNELAPLGFHVNREILAGAAAPAGASAKSAAVSRFAPSDWIIAASTPFGDAVAREFAPKAVFGGVRDNAFHDPPETA
jgi:hypothetical protein